jgi:hypothetical protein
MNDNTIESIEWHKDQLSKLLSDEIGFHKVESELDSILEKAKMKKKVQVRRGGKTFWREQEVGSKKDVPDMVGHFGGPKGEGKASDETKRLESSLTEAKKELKGHTNKDRIKRTKQIISDLETALKEQRADPQGRPQF